MKYILLSLVISQGGTVTETPIYFQDKASCDKMMMVMIPVADLDTYNSREVTTLTNINGSELKSTRKTICTQAGA
jgi:hypothetical protein